MVELDYRSLTPKDIEDLYQEGAYYPYSCPPPAGKKKEPPTLNFTICCPTTGWSKVYFRDDLPFTIGRHDCNINIEHITMPSLSLSFHIMNGVWMVRAPLRHPPALAQPGVYLCSERGMNLRQPSCRMAVNPHTEYTLQGVGFEVGVSVHKPNPQSNQI